MKLCAISDVHEQFRTLTYKIKDVDVLVVAGDFTYYGEIEQLKDFNTWIGELKRLGTIKHCVTTCGNHDKTFELKSGFAADEWNQHFLKTNQEALNSATEYHLLIDQEIVIDGVKFYGTPWTSVHGGGWAFQLHSNEQKHEVYSKVPTDVNIWIGHGPPYGINDFVARGGGVNAGCKILLEYIEKIKPKYYICGHLHDPKNHTPIKLDCGTTCINAAICNESYQPIQEPIYVEI